MGNMNDNDHLRGRGNGPPHIPSHREQAALIPYWGDIIHISDTKIFLWMEGMYCLKEKNMFRACNDNDEKEEWRLLVLEKRQEFLQLWSKNIYKIKQ